MRYFLLILVALICLAFGAQDSLAQCGGAGRSVSRSRVVHRHTGRAHVFHVLRLRSCN
jgi:hypothetical protein